MHVCMCYPLYVCMLCMNLYMLISYEFCLCTIYLSIYLSMFVMYVYVSIIYALYVCVLYGRKFWNSSASWGGWLPFGLPFFSFPFLFLILSSYPRYRILPFRNPCQDTSRQLCHKFAIHKPPRPSLKELEKARVSYRGLQCLTRGKEETFSIVATFIVLLNPIFLDPFGLFAIILTAHW